MLKKRAANPQHIIIMDNLGRHENRWPRWSHTGLTEGLLLLVVPSGLVFSCCTQKRKRHSVRKMKKKMLVLDKAGEDLRITYPLAILSFSGLKIK